MKFQPEDKLKELFKKHMNLKDTTEEDFEEGYFHQLEYFDWKVEGEEVQFVGSSGFKEPQLLNIFYGQEAQLPKIHEEFSAYVKKAYAYLLRQITIARGELSSKNIPCDKVYLSYWWSKIVPTKILGMKVISPEYDEEFECKVESPREYGRSVPILDLEL